MILPSKETVAACQDALGQRAAGYEIDGCAYDITVTGNSSFTFDYRRSVDARIAARVQPVAPIDGAAPGNTSVTPPSAANGAVLRLSGTMYGGSKPATDPTAVRELAGTVPLAEGAVLVARADVCLPGTNSLLTVTHHDSGLTAIMPLCDQQGLNASSAGSDDEVVNGEAYVWASQAGLYDVKLTTDSVTPSFVTVEFFTDATPTIVASKDFSGSGYRGSISGIGDTVVLLADTGTQSASWTATGLDTVCAISAYGAGSLGERGATTLGFCGHTKEIAIAPTSGQVVPIVLFSRTAGTTAVDIAP